MFPPSNTTPTQPTKPSPTTTATMRREAWPKTEDLQKELDWYEDLNASVIKLDLEYKFLAVAYHCVEPDVRDEIATGVTDKHQYIYEYARGGEPPIPINLIRSLDNIVCQARFSARRGRWFDRTALRAGKQDATEQLNNLKRAITWIRERFAQIQQYDSTGKHAIVPGRGLARFDAMPQAQKSRFLLWASQMREVQIAKSTHSIKSVRDIVGLMMGEEERPVLEWPEVTPEPREGVRPRPSAAGERRRRRRLNDEPERELRESHGAGAAFGFR